MGLIPASFADIFTLCFSKEKTNTATYTVVNLRDESEKPTMPDPQRSIGNEDIVDTFSKSYKKDVRNILKAIDGKKDLISWDNDGVYIYRVIRSLAQTLLIDYMMLLELESQHNHQGGDSSCVCLKKSIYLMSLLLIHSVESIWSKSKVVIVTVPVTVVVIVPVIRREPQV